MREDIRRDNSEMLARYADILTNRPAFAAKADLMEMASALAMPPEEAAAYLMCEALGLDAAAPRGRLLMEKYIRPSLTIKTPSAYLDDPFARLLRGAKETRPAPPGRVALADACLPAMTLFPAGDLRVFPDGRVVQPVAFFTEDFVYPSLRDGGREWMSLHPNEIETILPGARAARGRVLCLGLGMGYYLYHAAVNPHVESVTAVERDPEIISLFTRTLLPLFPKDKIRLVRGDAFAFLPAPGEYDTVFADLWHDVSDGLPLWRRLKALEVSGIRYRYWLGETLECYDRGWV